MIRIMKKIIKFLFIYVFAVFVSLPCFILALPLAILMHINMDSSLLKDFKEFFSQIIHPIKTYKEM